MTAHAWANCSGPAGIPGDITFGSNNVMAYCNGSAWVNMGASSSVGFGTLTTGDLCVATSSTQVSCTSTGISLATQATGTLQAAQFPALTGDVTTTAGSLNTTIGANKVTLGDIAQIAGLSVLGTGGATTGNVGPITGTSNQVLTVNNAGTALAFGAINLTSASSVTGILSPVNGGTGINNGANSITLGGPFVTSGAFPMTLTATGSTSVTLPTSGTLLSTASSIPTSQLTGTVPVANGGTGDATLTAFGVMVGAGTSGVVTVGPGSAGQLFVGQGAANPAFETISGDVTLTSSGVATVASISGKAVTLAGTLTTAGAFPLTITTTGATSVTLPTSGTLLSTTSSIGTAQLTGIVAPANGGTGVANSATITLGGAINTAGAFTTAGAFPLTVTTTASTSVTMPTSGTLLSTASTIPASQLSGTVPVANGGTGDTTLTAHGLMVGEGSSNVANITTGSASQVLLSGGASADPVWSTATYPATTTANQILYSSAANTVAGLATANNGVLVTGSTGIPSIASTLPSAVQANITALGTVASGLWNGTLIGPIYGGTGLAAYSTGDILYASAANTLAALHAGTNGNVLTLAGGVPTWAASTGGVTSFSAGTTGLTPASASTGAIVLAGTLGVPNGGTGLNSETANVIYKGNGTAALAASSLTDNGTTLIATDNIDASGKGFVTEITNTSATTAHLAKLNTSGAAVISAITDTDGMVGVMIGTNGSNAQIAVDGQAACTFENAAVAGDFVTIGSTTAGDCHDAGTTRPTAAQTIGQVLTAGASGTTQTIKVGLGASALAGGAPIGSGTTNYVARWTPNGTTLGTGALYDNGTNVGIGTTTPNFPLDVRGTNSGSNVASVQNYSASGYSAIQFNNSSSSGVGAVGYSNASTGAWNQGTVYLTGPAVSIGVSSASIYVPANGNVGIGSTAPVATFDVEGAQFVANVGGTSTAGTWLDISNSSTGGTQWNIISSGSANSEGAGKLLLRSGTGGIDVETLQTNGFVGIGTTSPISLLANTATNTVDVSYGTGTASTGLTWLVGAGGYAHTLYNSSTASNADGLLVSTAATAATNTLLELDSGSTARLRVTGAGNVGIGTATPYTPLYVQGPTVNVASTTYYPAERLFMPLSVGSDRSLDMGGYQYGNYIQSWDTGTAWSNLLLNPQGGNVGIGTVAPASELHQYVASGISAHTIQSGSTMFLGLTANSGSFPAVIWDSSDPLQFGTVTGTNYAGYSGKMIITAAGNVGIGTTSPGQILHVYSNGSPIQVDGPTSQYKYVRYATAGTARWDAGSDSSTESGSNVGSNYYLNTFADNGSFLRTPLYILRSNGDVGINTTSPTYTLQVNGSIAGTSAYNNTSDARLKKDVTPIAYGLDTVLKLRPVGFNWIDQSQDWKKKHQLGLIAQEVEPVVPEVVTIADDKIKTRSLAYGELVPVVIKAVQELKSLFDTDHDALARLQATNDNLRTVNDSEEAEIKALAARLDALEARRQ